MNSSARGAVVLLLLLANGGCTRVALQPEVPAVLDASTSQYRATLQAALRDALGVTPAPLADDVLTRDSMLTIEKVRLEGREVTRPERFQLVKSGNRCVLVQQRTGRRLDLGDLRCHAQ